MESINSQKHIESRKPNLYVCTNRCICQILLCFQYFQSPSIIPTWFSFSVVHAKENTPPIDLGIFTVSVQLQKESGQVGKKIREGDKPWETPNSGKHTKGCRKEGGWGGWGDWVMGPEEATWWDEHWGLDYMLASWIWTKKLFKKKKDNTSPPHFHLKRRSSWGLIPVIFCQKTWLSAHGPLPQPGRAHTEQALTSSINKLGLPGCWAPLQGAGLQTWRGEVTGAWMLCGGQGFSASDLRQKRCLNSEASTTVAVTLQPYQRREISGRTPKVTGWGAGKRLPDLVSHHDALCCPPGLTGAASG